MLQIAQILTIAFIISSILEADTGRVISAHMEFNEKLAGVVVLFWCVFWAVELL